MGENKLPPNSFILSPSLLSSDFTRLGEQLILLEQSGADWVHIDVMDGHFVPNLTIGPLMVEACRRCTNLPLDVHLMVSNPDELLKLYVDAGADWITVHVETCRHLNRTLQNIRGLGSRAGVALNPATPLNVLDWVFEDVDMVLLLSVNPGFSGQRFIPETLDKIQLLSEKIQSVNPEILIQVDGGITIETLPSAYKAGARVFVAGNAVFKHKEGIQEGVAQLRGTIH
jgi:ribulose-phosphate 3-epimerase